MVQNFVVVVIPIYFSKDIAVHVEKVVALVAAKFVKILLLFLPVFRNKFTKL